MSASSSFAADYLTNPPLLRGEERWEIENGRRCDPAEQFVRGQLQSHPAVPVQIRRGNDVPEKAAPFHQSTFDIAVTQRIRGDLVATRGMRDDLANDFRRAGAVMYRDAHLEVSRMIGPFIHALAERPEPSA